MLCVIVFSVTFFKRTFTKASPQVEVALECVACSQFGTFDYKNDLAGCRTNEKLFQNIFSWGLVDLKMFEMNNLGLRNVEKDYTKKLFSNVNLVVLWNKGALSRIWKVGKWNYGS